MERLSVTRVMSVHPGWSALYVHADCVTLFAFMVTGLWAFPPKVGLCQLRAMWLPTEAAWHDNWGVQGVGEGCVMAPAGGSPH